MKVTTHVEKSRLRTLISASYGTCLKFLGWDEILKTAVCGRLRSVPGHRLGATRPALSVQCCPDKLVLVCSLATALGVMATPGDPRSAGRATHNFKSAQGSGHVASNHELCVICF